MTASVDSPAMDVTDDSALEARKYLASRLATKSTETSFRSIPVIDVQSSFSGTNEDRQAIAKQIHEACTTVGFFYITGHGMEETCNATLKLAKRFFNEVPESSKEAIHIKTSKYFRGWEPASFSSVDVLETKNPAKETKEAFNWGYEAGLDPTGGDGKYVELDGAVPDSKANLWPSEDAIPGFYQGISEYYGSTLQLCRHLCRLFALSLDLPEFFFNPMITHPGGIARLIKYKASENPQPLSFSIEDQEIGLGAHSDYECFTLLLQDSVPGLEILSPDGHWISATPIQGGIVVNVADFLMRWTNGVYKSTVHRVINRTAEERYSIPLFFSINYDEKVETLPSCISEDNPAKFPPITAGKYVLDRLAATVLGGYQ
ncbi:oxidoreductase-like protein [Calycina marina]|uniref:Oxidoreductase-like protein n=1 Tax=Calycina marina TaxID=1763456 RepID=A0A9P7YUX0_9HELO|nr:oxidoreductase-like protein [Calycina marina]